MFFNDIELRRIKNEVGGLCSKRSPAHLKDQLRFEYEIDKQSVIIYEVRPAWDDPTEFTRSPMAKLTYVIKEKAWKLYWQRANMKWVKYEPKEISKALRDLVQEIDNDEFGCFFG